MSVRPVRCCSSGPWTRTTSWLRAARASFSMPAARA